MKSDLFHYFPINAAASKVFEIISTPEGFDAWWSESCTGKSALGETFQFSFGPEYRWTAVVSKYVPGKVFELQFNESDEDWKGSNVRFELSEKNSVTQVHFCHTGWKENNEHFRISNYCWAMYLRLLKRYIEFGEFVPYQKRLEA